MTSNGWAPPENPNPGRILDEARLDAADGHYEVALAKHRWYQDYSLEVDPAVYGVRLSFALGNWKDLADVYPPALQAMIEERDKARARVESGENPFAEFHDLQSINRELGEPEKTVELFKKLDAENPGAAKQVFDLILPQLVRVRELALCSKYLDSEKEYRTATSSLEFRRHLERTASEACSEEALDRHFESKVAIIVALLTRNERHEEAAAMAADAKTHRDNAAFAAKLEKALEGEFPEKVD